jgi:hypothetical protein
MTELTLFVGWGEVVKLYYWPHLRPLYESGRLIPVIAETEAKCRVVPGLLLPWGSVELEEMISAGRFRRIFILSPPALHLPQLLHCVELLRSAGSRCDLFVEKPLGLDYSEAAARLRRLDATPLPDGVVVRHIDHYTQKWAVRWLRAHFDEVTGLLGRLTEVLFVSLERREITDSPVFAAGYAREHGIHAWALLDHCIPPLVREGLDVEAVHAWRHRDCPPICSAESAFRIDYQARGPALAGMPVRICAGKAMAATDKRLVLRGADAEIVAYFNKDRICYRGPGGERSLGDDPPDDDGGLNRRPAYRTIMEGIFERNAGEDVTIGLEEGLLALERIDRAASRFPSPVEYPRGETPRKIAGLLG